MTEDAIWDQDLLRFIRIWIDPGAEEVNVIPLQIVEIIISLWYFHFVNWINYSLNISAYLHCLSLDETDKYLEHVYHWQMHIIVQNVPEYWLHTEHILYTIYCCYIKISSLSLPPPPLPISLSLSLSLSPCISFFVSLSVSPSRPLFRSGSLFSSYAFSHLPSPISLSFLRCFHWHKTMFKLIFFIIWTTFNHSTDK